MKETLIFWSVAFLITVALNWPPAWALVIFALIAIGMKAHRARNARKKARNLPETLVAAQAPVVPVQLPKARTHPAFPERADGPFDPFVETPKVFASAPNWAPYEHPAYQRRRADLSKFSQTPTHNQSLKFPDLPSSQDEITKDSVIDHNRDAFVSV